MAQQWYYLRDGKEHGPLSAAVLLEMAKKGELLPTDLLWKDGTENRRPAADFPKLFAKGGTPPSQMPQRDSLSSGTAIVGLSGSRSSADDPADARQDQSPDPPSAEPSSLKGLTMALGIEPAKPGQDPLLGCDIGGVTIVRLIAEGGMGRVYEGKQEKPNRTVAVKVMRPGLTSPSILKRFEYEAEVLGRLQHPGIAHIYSVGVHRMGNASVPYFIMEYIADARTLTKYANDLKLPARQRLDLFRSVCDAVAHGHQKGVIHRDLKPSNILVDGSGQPKVIDFGVARATDSDMALTTMQTDVGQLIGTLQYMSPEQFKADPNDIDVRSDVYALGVILYELLAGKLPYDIKKKAIHEVARIVQEDDPTPLSSFNRSLKGDVAVIAGKCLEKDRGRRYSSASELGADLGRYLTGEPISASPPGFVDGLVRLAKKHRAAAAAVAGVFASLMIGVVGIGLFAARAEQQRIVALGERDRANANERKAEQARAMEEEQRRQAEAAENLAMQEKAAATQRLYEANLYRMEQLLKEGNYRLSGSLFQEVTTGFGYDGLPFELRHVDSLLRQDFVRYEGHRGSVRAIAFSPDGSRLATGSDDKTVRLWDVATGTQLFDLQGHDGPINCLVFSPDGTRLATVGGGDPFDFIAADTTARLWDTATGKLSAVLQGHTGSIRAAAFSPDGALLATGGCKGSQYDSATILWNAANGRQVAVLEGHKKSINALVFSPDGTQLATGSQDGTARLWDVATGKQRAVLEGQGKDKRGSVGAVAFSADGARLATGSTDNAARLWDAASGNQLVVLEGHERPIRALAFSPDGAQLATGSEDMTARLWDVIDGKQLVVLVGHRNAIDNLAFSPDGTKLATGSRDNTSRLWEVPTGRRLTVLKGHSNAINALAFSPDNTRLATASVDKTARLWGVSSNDELTVLKGHSNVIGALAFSPDGTRLATGSADNTVRLWDAATGVQLAVLVGHNGAITAVAFSPDGTRLATRSTDSSVRVWDAATGQRLAMLKVQKSKIIALAFSPDGTLIATGSDDNNGRLWDISTGEQRALLEGQTSVIVALELNRSCAQLAAGSADRTAGLWSVATRGRLVLPNGHKKNAIRVQAFSADGARLATVGHENTLRLWGVTTGKQLAALEGHEKSIHVLAFNPDGTRLATGSDDKTARIWDVATGMQLAVLEGHDTPIRALAFSPDGTRLVTAGGPMGKWGSSSDTTARLWDVAAGKQLVVLEGHDGLINAIVFSPDGTRMATASGSTFHSGRLDTTARLWGVSTAAMYRARLETEAIERRLDDSVTAWLKHGPDSAVAKLKEAKATLTPDEYRVAGNMILSRSASGSHAAAHK